MDLRLERTMAIRGGKACPKYPEQYDVFDGTGQVALIVMCDRRLLVRYLGGGTLLIAHTLGRVVFEDKERERWLNLAQDLIAQRIKGGPQDTVYAGKHPSYRRRTPSGSKHYRTQYATRMAKKGWGRSSRVGLLKPRRVKIPLFEGPLISVVPRRSANRLGGFPRC